MIPALMPGVAGGSLLAAYLASTTDPSAVPSTDAPTSVTTVQVSSDQFGAVVIALALLITLAAIAAVAAWRR